MFNIAKFKLEMILVLVFALICGGVYLSMQHKDKKIDQLKETVVVQKVENASIKQDNAVKDGAAKVNEAVNADVKEHKDKVVAKVDKIKAKTDTKLAEVEKLFETKPKTEENVAAKAVEVSKVVIEGVWENYCVAAPDNPKCHMPVPAGEPISGLLAGEPEPPTDTM